MSGLAGLAMVILIIVTTSDVICDVAPWFPGCVDVVVSDSPEEVPVMEP